MSISFHIDEATAGQRLDVFCASQMPGYSRSAIQKAIKDDKILVNGVPVKSRYILKTNDVIRGDIGAPVAIQHGPESVAELKIPIIYEDRDVVVIDKPAGITVHAGVNTSKTVADWFIARYPDAREVGEEGRAGIVHRLDKDTSGVMILAKNEAAYIHLKNQFQQRHVRKEYLALVFGVPGGKDGRITRPLMRSRRNPMRRTVVDEKDLATLKLRRAHKEAATEWRVERKFGSSYALLRVLPFTGRMHQIRVHLHFLGYPIVGDQLYTFKRKKQPLGVKRHLLHAEKLTIELPSEKKKTFIAPLAQDFDEVIRTLSYH